MKPGSLQRRELQKFASKKRATVSASFFKTGPGEYGEGDIFVGISVPDTRAVATRFKDSTRADLLSLLHSKIHEERLLALIILVDQFQRGSEKEQKDIYKLYLSKTRYVNNWDLVDTSAAYIVGVWLEKRDRKILFKLARSRVLWERRIAIISTFHFIRKDDFSTTLELASIFLRDKEDLMHKAVGWMLREVGKRSSKVLEAFLNENVQKMPRTMLRYAIERFPEKKRKQYLSQK